MRNTFHFAFNYKIYVLFIDKCTRPTKQHLCTPPLFIISLICFGIILHLTYDIVTNIHTHIYIVLFTCATPIFLQASRKFSTFRRHLAWFSLGWKTIINNKYVLIESKDTNNKTVMLEMLIDFNFIKLFVISTFLYMRCDLSKWHLSRDELDIDLNGHSSQCHLKKN